MNHRPFEDWLLEDQSLTPEQKRELDSHLRTCTYCTALAETGLALRTARAVAPASGFTSRFQMRLAAQRVADRRRRLIGSILFVLGGLALLMWLSWPLLSVLINSPAQWLSTVVSWGVFIITTLRALSEAGSIILRVLPGALSPLVLLMLISAFGGLGLLWTVSIWRVARVPQGV